MEAPFDGLLTGICRRPQAKARRKITQKNEWREFRKIFVVTAVLISTKLKHVLNN